MKKNIIRVLVATICTISIVYGYSIYKKVAKPEKNNDYKTVELSIYVFGGQPLGTPKVLEQLNKMTKKDLNCTVKINSISWNDWPTKYSLLLASGEPIDMIYTSSWAGFNDQVQKGAYLALDSLLPQYAPETLKTVPKLDWEQAKFKGKIYAVPNTAPTFDPWGIVVRKDLRERYKLPPIDSIKSFEKYLDVIKQNEKDLIPLDLGSIDISIEDFLNAENNWEKLIELPELAIKTDQSNIKAPFIIADTSEFLEFAKTMKRWNNNGYWSENVLSKGIPVNESFKQGKSAAAIDHFMRVQDLAISGKEANPPYEIEYFPLSKVINVIHQDPIMQNAMAIPKNAPNPERALMLLDKLRNNEVYYRLTNYGIEDKNYIITEDGKYKLPEGVTEANNSFPSEQFSWAWRNINMALKPEKPKWDQFDSFYKDFSIMATPNKLVNFKLDKEPIRIELSGISQVNSQYLSMILFGIGDPTENVEKYREQLKFVGIDKVQEEVKKQLRIYVQENNF